MFMMISQILKFAVSSKAHKFKHLENETFFLQKTKSFHDTLRRFFNVNQNAYFQIISRACINIFVKIYHSPAGNYMFKVNNENITTKYEISSKLTI